MNAAQDRELRRSSRHEVFLQVLLQELPPPGIAPASAATIAGETRNISSHGLCAELDRACPDSALLRCEFQIAGCPVAIPTLVHVRWLQNGHGKCVAGLEFLPQ